MEVLTIIWIVVAAVAGAALTYFWISRKKTDTGKGQEWSVERERLEKECEQKILEREKKTENIKSSYEILLAEAKANIARLDGQLKNCLEGHVDENVKEQLAGIDKLKKQIKDLQDEIEDCEDDIDNYKKKLKKKDEENDVLQEQLDKETESSRLLHEELEKVKAKLEDKVNELNLKVESLCFVQEILSASRIGDTDIKALYNKVDNLYNFIGSELRDCIKSESINGEEDYFGSGLEEWAVTAKKQWIRKKTSIAFVGEFSAGKTSIVNRILSQDNPDVPLLPVSTKATTAIPTYISGGVNTRYSFVTPDNIQKNLSEDTFKRVNKEVLDQVKGVSSLIQYFVMAYKNRNLDNLSILDTPGFNSNDKEDAERTIGVINECDALFWVFDVNAGTVNRSSIRLIKENLKKPLFVVVNKVDTKAETEVNKVEQLIRKTLLDNNVQVQKFIRFSAKAPLEDMMNPIRSVAHRSLSDQYTEKLRAFVDGKAKELEKKVKEAYESWTSLSNKCDELDAASKRTIDQLKEYCKDTEKIPRWEEHFFSKDRYEMNEVEYYRFVEFLNQIRNVQLKKLCRLHKEQEEAREKAGKANDDLVKTRREWWKMKDCKERLDKYIREYEELK
ncbi:dynamin family protein [Parabacteroides sp. ZJ-118]|uniref:dynamin family protein n=1 Tax=Parabacteroides sp. ZJ-118 TaxID=2709398 RepID=UPI0013EB552E|nr:dynamin family protein [Parabacteroides sp. ZJ-118]